VLAPAPVPSPDSLVAVVSSEGKLLAFPVGEVPEDAARQGQQALRHSGQKAAARVELMTAVAVVPPKASLVLCPASSTRCSSGVTCRTMSVSAHSAARLLRRGWPRQYRPAGNAAGCRPAAEPRKRRARYQGCRNPIANRNDSHSHLNLLWPREGNGHGSGNSHAEQGYPKEARALMLRAWLAPRAPCVTGVAAAADDARFIDIGQQLAQVQAQLQQLAQENRSLREHQQQIERQLAQLTGRSRGAARAGRLIRPASTVDPRDALRFRPLAPA